MSSAQMRQMLNAQISLLFGEKTLSLYTNTIGKVSPSEIEIRFTFEEIVSLQKILVNSEYIKLLELCEEHQLINALDFLTSFMDVVVDIYSKYSELAMMESDNKLSDVSFKAQAQDLYNKNANLFKQEFGKLITSSQKTKDIFQSVFLKDQDMSSVSTDKLREAMRMLSVAGIAHVLNRKYTVLRAKPINHFKTFFNTDDNNMAMSVVKDLQDNGF